jgi:transcription antitermination factor NusA-like protein
MTEVSSAGNNDAQHLMNNKCKNSDTVCIKCEELESKLQETLLELSSAKLIIKLLQKEIDMITAPACTMRPNIDSGFYGEH